MINHSWIFAAVSTSDCRDLPLKPVANVLNFISNPIENVEYHLPLSEYPAARLTDGSHYINAIFTRLVSKQGEELEPVLPDMVITLVSFEPALVKVARSQHSSTYEMMLLVHDFTIDFQFLNRLNLSRASALPIPPLFMDAIKSLDSGHCASQFLCPQREKAELEAGRLQQLTHVVEGGLIIPITTICIHCQQPMSASSDDEYFTPMSEMCGEFAGKPTSPLPRPTHPKTAVTSTLPVASIAMNGSPSQSPPPCGRVEQDIGTEQEMPATEEHTKRTQSLSEMEQRIADEVDLSLVDIHKEDMMDSISVNLDPLSDVVKIDPASSTKMKSVHDDYIDVNGEVQNRSGSMSDAETQTNVRMMVKQSLLDESCSHALDGGPSRFTFVDDPIPQLEAVSDQNGIHEPGFQAMHEEVQSGIQDANQGMESGVVSFHSPVAISFSNSSESETITQMKPSSIHLSHPMRKENGQVEMHPVPSLENSHAYLRTMPRTVMLSNGTSNSPQTDAIVTLADDSCMVATPLPDLAVPTHSVSQTTPLSNSFPVSEATLPSSVCSPLNNVSSPVSKVAHFNDADSCIPEAMSLNDASSPVSEATPPDNTNSSPGFVLIEDSLPDPTPPNTTPLDNSLLVHRSSDARSLLPITETCGSSPCAEDAPRSEASPLGDAHLDSMPSLLATIMNTPPCIASSGHTVFCATPLIISTNCNVPLLVKSSSVTPPNPADPVAFSSDPCHVRLNSHDPDDAGGTFASGALPPPTSTLPDGHGLPSGTSDQGDLDHGCARTNTVYIPPRFPRKVIRQITDRKWSGLLSVFLKHCNSRLGKKRVRLPQRHSSLLKTHFGSVKQRKKMALLREVAISKQAGASHLLTSVQGSSSRRSKDDCLHHAGELDALSNSVASIGTDSDSDKDDSFSMKRRKRRRLEEDKPDSLRLSPHNYQQRGTPSCYSNLSSIAIQENDTADSNTTSSSSKVDMDQDAPWLQPSSKKGCRGTRNVLDSSNESSPMSLSAIPDDAHDYQMHKLMSRLKEPEVVLSQLDIRAQLLENQRALEHSEHSSAPMESICDLVKATHDLSCDDPIPMEAQSCNTSQDSHGRALAAGEVVSEPLLASGTMQKARAHLSDDVKGGSQNDSMLPVAQKSHISVEIGHKETCSSLHQSHDQQETSCDSSVPPVNSSLDLFANSQSSRSSSDLILPSTQSHDQSCDELLKHLCSMQQSSQDVLQEATEQSLEVSSDLPCSLVTHDVIKESGNLAQESHGQDLLNLCSLQGSRDAGQEPPQQSSQAPDNPSHTEESQDHAQDAGEAENTSGEDITSPSPSPDDGKWNYRMDSVANADFTPWPPHRPQLCLKWDGRSGHLKKMVSGLRLVRKVTDPKTRELAVDIRTILSLASFSVEPPVDCSKAIHFPSPNAGSGNRATQPMVVPCSSLAAGSSCGVNQPRLLNARVVLQRKECDVFDSGSEQEDDVQLRVNLTPPSLLVPSLGRWVCITCHCLFAH